MGIFVSGMAVRPIISVTQVYLVASSADLDLWNLFIKILAF